MRRLATVLGAAFLLSANPPSANAAEIVASGPFQPDAFGYFSENYFLDGPSSPGFGPLAPGKYFIELQLSSPVSDFFGRVYSQIWINDFCTPNFLLCGFDDNYTNYPLSQISSTRYSTSVVRVSRTTTVPLPFAEYDTNAIRVTQDLCCGAEFDFAPTGPGTYTISVTNIPEPATWMMLLMGFGAIGAGIRNMRHRKAGRQLASA